MDSLPNNKLEQHLALVIKANETTNITRIASPESGRILHIEDSLVALPEINAAPEGLYGDMGSGAGYPGIPLALETGRETVLIESVTKKAAILQGFLEPLGLAENASVFSGRIEDLTKTKSQAFAVLTARALAQLSVLMELACPLLQPHGRLICYKANVSEEELSHAASLERKFGLYLISDRECYLSDGETYRRIFVYEKRGNPQIKLPRHVGFAQKKPL